MPGNAAALEKLRSVSARRMLNPANFMNQKSPCKVALIGVGQAAKSADSKDGCKIGYQHAKNLADYDRAKMVAGVDIHEENLRAWQSAFGIENGFLDYEKMLEEVRPDIVCIATYVGLHYPMIEQAARAGVPAILCEKPFLNSPAEIVRLRKLIEETGIKIVVNHMRRYQPIFGEIRKKFSEESIGALELMSAGINGWDLSEWGAHWLDVFRFLNHDAPVEWVFGQTRTRTLRAFGHAMEEHAVAYFQFANGCKAIVDGGSQIGGAIMAIQGSKGLIRIVNEGSAEIFTASGREVLNCSSYGPELWLGPWNALIDWMEGGAEPELGATNQLLTSELNLAAYVSALAGDRVDLPLDSDLAVWPVDAIADKGGVG